MIDHSIEPREVYVGIAFVLLVSVAVLVFTFFGGCSVVTVHAEREGRCTFKRAAPFVVHCTSDGKPVLDWTGPMALDVQEVK